MGMNDSMKLTGDRCQCPACDEYFNSTAAFDKHRRGEHGVNRHCLTPETMLERGMSKNKTGFWITSAMPPEKVKTRRNPRGETSNG